jgi:hypothetical protein
MRHQVARVPEFNLWPDDTIRANVATGMNFGVGIDDGCGVDFHLPPTMSLSPDRFLRGSFFSAYSIDQPASDKGFGGEGVPNVSGAFHAPSVSTPDFHHNLDAKLIARDHRATKSGALNSGEQHQLGVAIFHFRKQQDTASLGHSLDDEDTRHHREPGKVSGKKRFVDRDVLDGYNPLPPLKIDDAVNQQERKTVRQDVLDLIDVQRNLGGHGGFGCRLSNVGHSVSRQY